MHYTTLGRTSLRVSVAGLGINFIDTAPAYGTEGVVGRALKTIPRDQVGIATKAPIHRGAEWWPLFTACTEHNS